MLVIVHRLPRCPYLRTPAWLSSFHSQKPCYSTFTPPLRTGNMSTLKPSQEQIHSLSKYTACDIADALLKLKVPNAGYLPDLKLITPSPSSITIAPASTVVFASKIGGKLSDFYPDVNIPAGKHWVDLTEPETIVVMAQPEGQKCAVLGGIMALRMKVLGAKGVVVNGRVRDVVELGETGLPVSCFFIEELTVVKLHFIPLCCPFCSFP
jgi:regulator of RNase E activity RraA